MPRPGFWIGCAACLLTGCVGTNLRPPSWPTSLRPLARANKPASIPAVSEAAKNLETTQKTTDRAERGSRLEDILPPLSPDRAADGPKVAVRNVESLAPAKALGASGNEGDPPTALDKADEAPRLDENIMLTGADGPAPPPPLKTTGATKLPTRDPTPPKPLTVKAPDVDPFTAGAPAKLNHAVKAATALPAVGTEAEFDGPIIPMPSAKPEAPTKAGDARVIAAADVAPQLPATDGGPSLPAIDMESEGNPGMETAKKSDGPSTPVMPTLPKAVPAVALLPAPSFDADDAGRAPATPTEAAPKLLAIKPIAEPSPPIPATKPDAGTNDPSDAKAPLALARLTFCKEVAGFGRIEPAPKTLGAGHPALLYVEVANFSSQAIKTGFETKLTGRIEIEPEAGGAALAIPFDEIVDHCRSRRQDFFCHFEFAVPDSLGPGVYVLRLRLRDVLSGATAEQSTRFTVAAPKQGG